jgi:hypothetical protein
MKRILVVGTATLDAAAVARRAARSRGGFDFERMIERMPDDAPPKWMFRNISAIRESTDRILRLLEDERRSVTDESTLTAAKR